MSQGAAGDLLPDAAGSDPDQRSKFVLGQRDSVLQQLGDGGCTHVAYYTR